MAKKITALSDYISASDASLILSRKSGRPIDPNYIRKLAKSKKQPVRTQQMSNRLLYNREDIEKATIRQKRT
jgi:hypothetical protein